MTQLWYKALQVLIGYNQTWSDHADNVAVSFYTRGLAQNITMVGFLGEYKSFQQLISGWLSILHFGPNSRMTT